MPRDPTAAILGIDVGSTSIRAFILSLMPSVESIEVENKARKHFGSKIELGDFTCEGYPFGTGPVYLRDAPDPTRQAIKLKYGTYLLAGANDKLLTEYPLFQTLLRHKHNSWFLERLRQGLREAFETIYERVRDICRARKMKIVEIGLTVPAQWTLDFEDVYKKLVTEVFCIEPSKVKFHFETQALAHYILRHHIHDIRQGDEFANVVLFLDFGGHSLSGCIFHVQYGKDDTASFFMIEEAFGAGGGSEQWEFNIGEACSREVEHICRNTHTLSPTAKASLLSTFNDMKTRLGPGGNEKFVGYCRPWEGAEATEIMLDPETVNECFENALRLPLQLAADNIEKVSGFGVIPQVVVSGGSARHEELQDRVRELCRQARIPDPIFTHGMEIRYESVKIAKGAAYATANRLTVEEFMNRGATIAVQRWCARDEMWEDEVYPLLDSKYQVRQRICLQNKSDKIKLVYYDLHDFGEHDRGEWTFSLTLMGSGDNISFAFERWHRPYKRKRSKRQDLLTLPLYFERGSNCIHIGEEGKALSELGLNLPQPKALRESGLNFPRPDHDTGLAGDQEDDSDGASMELDDDGDQLYTLLSGQSNDRTVESLTPGERRFARPYPTELGAAHREASQTLGTVGWDSWPMSIKTED